MNRYRRILLPSSVLGWIAVVCMLTSVAAFVVSSFLWMQSPFSFGGNDPAALNLALKVSMYVVFGLAIAGMLNAIGAVIRKDRAVFVLAAIMFGIPAAAYLYLVIRY